MRTRAPHRRLVARYRPRRGGGPDRRAGEQPPPRDRSPWWRRPRIRGALFLAVLAVIVLVGRLLAHFQTEWLWFDEVGQKRVFLTLLVRRWLAGGIAGLATSAFLLGNLWIAYRVTPADGASRDGRLLRVVLPAQIAVSAVVGLLIARSVVASDWQRLALWLHRSDFGVTDPLFHKDVGFFVFSLPL